MHRHRVNQLLLMARRAVPIVYATWNQADKSSGIVLSGGDLRADTNNSAWRSVRATLGLTTGKHRWKITRGDGDYEMAGVMTATETLESYCGKGPLGWSYSSHGFASNNNVNTGPGPTVDASEVFDCYLNLDDDLFYVYKASTQLMAADISDRGAAAMFPAWSGGTSGGQWSVANFGATSLGAAVTGFENYRAGVFTP